MKTPAQIRKLKQAKDKARKEWEKAILPHARAWRKYLDAWQAYMDAAFPPGTPLTK